MGFTLSPSFAAAAILLGVIACDADTSNDTSPPAWSPDLYCPGDPGGGCDKVQGAALTAGAGLISPAAGPGRTSTCGRAGFAR